MLKAIKRFFGKKATIGVLIAVVLLAAVCVGLLSHFTDGFQKSLGRSVNEDNLYTAECMSLKDSEDGSGIKINVNDDGSFKVRGKASEDVEYEIGTLILDAGTYTISAVDGASKSKIYVTANVGGIVHYADFTGDEDGKTFTVAADDIEVVLTLHIVADETIAKTVYPVIVSGEEEGSFYK